MNQIASVESFNTENSVCQQHNIGQDTQDKIRIWVAELRRWSEVHNLIGPNEHPRIWHHHIRQSLFAYSHVPAEARCVFDIGSGAGFPAIGIAAGFDNNKTPGLVTCFESNTKKSEFLKFTARRSGLPIESVNVRFGDIEAGTDSARPDIISVRAVASVAELARLTEHMFGEQTIGIWLKGIGAEAEVKIAQSQNRSSNLIYQVLPLGDGSDARIVRVTRAQTSAKQSIN